MGKHYDKLKCYIKSLIIEYFSRLFTILENLFPCPAIPIKKLPVTLNSGKYCLCGDLTYSGSGSAITIGGQGVELEGNGYSIVLTDPTATGIQVTGTGVSISRLGISQSINITATSSTGILCDGAFSVNISGVGFLGTVVGIRLQKCSGVIIKGGNIRVANPIMNSIGISISDSRNIELLGINTNSAGNDGKYISSGIVVEIGQNIQIAGCKLYNDQCINLISGNNIEILESLLTTGTSEFSGDMGSSGIIIGSGNGVNGILIQGLTISVDSGAPGNINTGVVLFNGSDCKILDCEIPDISTGNNYSFGAILVDGFTDVLIDNCVFSGSYHNPVYINTGTVRMIDTIVTGYSGQPEEAAVHVVAGNAYISNSKITTNNIGTFLGADGIRTESSSINNTFTNNIITSNIGIHLGGVTEVATSNIIYYNVTSVENVGTGDTKVLNNLEVLNNTSPVPKTLKRRFKC